MEVTMKNLTKIQSEILVSVLLNIPLMILIVVLFIKAMRS